MLGCVCVYVLINPEMRKGTCHVAFVLTLRQETRSNTEATGEAEGT